MAVTIDKAKVKKLFDNLEQLPVTFDKVTGDAVLKLAIQAGNFAKSHHPYEDQEGNLTRSIRGVGPFRELLSSIVASEVQATMEYAAFVELGTSRTRPHPFLKPAAFAVMRGSKGVAVFKKEMGEIKLARGLKSKSRLMAEIDDLG